MLHLCMTYVVSSLVCVQHTGGQLASLSLHLRVVLQELKRVCLDFVSRNLAAVMQTDGYRHMTRSCPSLQAELLQVIASAGPAAAAAAHDRHGAHRAHGQHVRRLEEGVEERRVRQRRNE